MNVYNPCKQTAAFSLIEVMVACAVLGIVMAILLGTLTTSMALWRDTEKKLAADREGRAGELLIAQDLANALVPSSMALWPKLTTNDDSVFLQFLATKPLDYQPADEGNAGDVCFVEYFVGEGGSALFRNFYASAWTYENVLQAGTFPAPTTNEAQVLAMNLLADARDSVRGLPLYDEASTDHFVILATNNPGQPGQILPMAGPPDPNNPPVAIEVNFAVADEDAIANEDLLDDPAYKLRHAGFFSFRVALPKTAQ